MHLADHLGQHLLGHPLIGQCLRRGVVARVEPAFAQLQIPVADIVPGELIKALGRFAKGITAVSPCRFLVHPGQTGQNPAISELQGSGVWIPQLRWRGTPQIHQCKPGGIPEFVREIPRSLHRRGRVLLSVVIEADVLSCPGHFPHQSKAQGIGAVALNQQQRIDAIAGTFAHLAVLLIPHQAMDINILKGHFTRENAGHHRHPGHPEKDDVEARHQGAGGVPALKVSCICIRPAQC